MGSARITASDVAKAAGVSQPTVSRVFNRSATVDPVKAERVRAVAQGAWGISPTSSPGRSIPGSSFRIGIVLAYLKERVLRRSLAASLQSTECTRVFGHGLFLQGTTRTKSTPSSMIFWPTRSTASFWPASACRMNSWPGSVEIGHSLRPVQSRPARSNGCFHGHRVEL